MAMEYVEGMTLEQKMVETPKVGLAETAKIIEQIGAGLKHAHDRGIVHRDVKPANVMLTGPGNTIKIMDFGIAKIVDSKMTQTGKSLGTPNYMSPEQIRGEPVDFRSDIFSLGVIAFELLVGNRPFKGNTLTALSYSIINKKQGSVAAERPEIGGPVDVVFERALAKSSGDRYNSAVEFSQQLREALGATGS